MFVDPGPLGGGFHGIGHVVREALKQQYLFEVMRNSYQMMKRLSDADSLRLSLGSIKAIDATQSKIEAGVLLNDLFQFDADRKNSFLNLSTTASTYRADTLLLPELISP